MRKTLFIALSLFFLDVAVLNYWFILPAVLILIGGLSATLIRYVYVLITKKGILPTKQTWLRHGIYLLAIILIIATNMTNNSIAKSRAENIINILEKYRLAHGAYPAKLTDLVPNYMDEIPHPKPIASPRIYKFIYHKYDKDINGKKDTTYLLEYIVIPPLGREIYDSRTREWSSLG